MIVCDRCKKKIINVTDETHQSLVVYSNEGIWHNIDLCEECIREKDVFIHKAESYFMTNTENPSSLFEGKKYWKEREDK